MDEFRLRRRGKAQAQQPQKQAPSSSKSESLLSKAGGVAGSGLHAVGSLLSFPSRLLWGTVNAATGGKEGFGNTSLLDSTGGVELSRILTRAGAIPENDPNKWEAMDFGRGLIDMVGDPTSYLGIGALSRSGQAASRTGALAPGLVNQIRQGQRGLVGLQIPFAPSTLRTVGTGPRVADALDSAGVTRGLTSIHNSLPAVHLRRLFHASAMGRNTARTQEAARRAYDEQTRLLEAADMGAVNTARNMQLMPGGPRAPEAERHMVEMGRPSPEIRPLRDQVNALHAEKMNLGIATGNLNNEVKGFQKVGPQRARRTHVLDANGNIVNTIDHTANAPVRPDAGDVNYLVPNQRVEHANRYISEGMEWGGIAGRGSQIAMDAQANIDQKRNVELFGNASTDMINRVFRAAGEFLQTLPPNLSENQRARSVGKFIKREFRGEDVRAGTNLTGNYHTGSRTAAADTVQAHSRPRELGQFIVNNPQLTATGPFTNHPVHDMHTALRVGSEQVPKARNALRFMAENARVATNEPLDMLRQNGLDNPPTVLEAANQLSINPGRAAAHVLSQLPPQLAADVNARARAEAMRQARHQVSQGSGRNLNDIADELFNETRDRMVLDLQLPASEYSSLIGFRDPIPRPQNGLASSLNTIWKANMLAHPATQARNALSATVTSALQGAATPSDLGRGIQLVRGQNVSGLASHPDVASLMGAHGIDETESLRRLAAVHFPVNNSVLGDLPPGQVGSTLADLQSNVPGRTQTPLSAIVTDPLRAFAGFRDGQHVGWNAANPLAIAGAFGRETTDYGPAMAANMTARNIEQPIRVGSMMGLMRQGYSAREAARRVGQAQVNYGNREFSDFEKVLKQWVPFYSFNSRAGKYVAGELATNPGGPMAQIVKAQDRASGVDPTIPDSVSSGTAIPLGQRDDGTKTFLSGLGLAHEPAVETIGSLLGGDYRGAGYNLAGMLNPFIKTPAEALTQQSFYQRGEPAQNLDPNIGRTLSNIGAMAGLRDKDAGPVRYPGDTLAEAALAMSPASRIVGTVKGLTDTRKTVPQRLINALTGLRITDVSPQKQEATLMRRAEQLAKESGAKSRSDVYFNKDELARLDKTDPEAAARQRELQALLNAIKANVRAGRPPSKSPSIVPRAKSSYTKKGEFRLRKSKK